MERNGIQGGGAGFGANALSLGMYAVTFLNSFCFSFTFF